MEVSQSKQGAEAVVTFHDDRVCKKRLAKSYRVSELDDVLRKERTRAEARTISEARRNGVPTPIIFDVCDDVLWMEFIQGDGLKYVIDESLSTEVGRMIGRLHTGEIIHGDLTTSNMILSDGRIYLIDFGLAFFDQSTEARGVDVHVLFQTYESTHEEHEQLIEAFKHGYRETFPQADEVLERVTEIESRGRYL